MSSRNYWLDLFTGTTWQEFLDSGATTSGFRESRWKTVQKIKIGDYFLCYLTGISRFVGVLEVVSEGFRDSSPIWKDEDFPCRLKVRIIAALTPETAVPVFELRDRLTFFQKLKNPHAWTGKFRGSPARWDEKDGSAVVEAVHAALANPTQRPVDQKKLARRPRAILTDIGAVTVPDKDESDGDISGKEPSTPHTEIQWLLLKLGSDMGLSVWAARNDRNRLYQGQRFNALPGIIEEVPRQFDEVTNRTIELIDVLWLKGKAIVAAFEIESTTSVYSGLLRMADLLSMQPNLKIPLYLVAPDDRREKVIMEVNRPTFAHVSPPLSEICRYLAFSVLRSEVLKLGNHVRHLKPEFIEEIAESCEVEEA